MRVRRLTTVTVGVIAVGIGTASGVAPSAYADTAPTATSPEPTACAPLPAYVEGRPAHLHVRAATGDYLWHDASGWHLRVTHPSRHRAVFRGVITADAPMHFQRVRDEKHDKVMLSADEKTLVFRFINHGGIDGVDFTDSCASTTKFSFALNGHRVGRNHIYIGANSARPARDPFVISRNDAAAAA